MILLEEHLDYWLSNINEHINKNIKSSNAFLNSVLQDHIIGGGKRIRALFCVGASCYGDFNEERTLKAAAAIEILHAATLIHDDVIDRSEKRRGKDTINSAYSVDLAVYTGDFLFTKAVFLLSGLISEKYMEMLAKGIKSVCVGEVIQYQEKYNSNLSELKYFRIISRKTAFLFSASCVLGGCVSNLKTNQQSKMAKFGFNYGMAFQIQDDLKDLLSEEEIEGKPIFNDIKAGIMTLPLIYACKSSKIVRELLSCHGKEGYFNRDIEFCRRVKSEVLKTDAIDKTKQVINKYKIRMEKILKSMPSNDKIDIFTLAIAGLMPKEEKM